VETSLHLALEAVDVFFLCFGDDQELLLPPSSHVERVLGGHLAKPNLPSVASSFAFQAHGSCRNP
jgi:hypothetical protein